MSFNETTKVQDPALINTKIDLTKINADIHHFGYSIFLPNENFKQ